MEQTEESRLEEILNFIIAIARGNYNIKLSISERNDKFDAIASGLNMMVDDIRLNEEEIILNQRKFFQQALNKVSLEVGQLLQNSSTQYVANDIEISDNRTKSKSKLKHLPRIKEAIAETITKRELEILGYIVDGFTSREIAEKLSISLRTATTHRNNLMQKLKAKNTADLIKMTVIENKNLSLSEQI